MFFISWFWTLFSAVNMDKNKRKGDAEKLKDKKRRKMEDEGKTCKNISQMFSQVNDIFFWC